MKINLRRVKDEKAAATTLVVVTVLSFLVILMGAFLTVTALRQSQLKSDIRIQEIYGQDVDKIDEVYDKLTRKEGSILAGQTAIGENRVYVDSNNDAAVIPQGFAVSGISGENTIENGLVIYQTGEINITDWSDANAIRNKYNQWVWVPVANPSEMYEENQNGVALGGGTGVTTKRYSKSEIISGITRTTPGDKTDCREPDLVLGNGNECDAVNYETAGFASLKDMAQNLALDYNEMLDSVNQFKGFYVGRYELTGTVDNPTEKSGEVLVNQNWYNLYKACKYFGKDNDNIETRMIWGIEWDETCKYINERGKKVTLDNVNEYANCKDVNVKSSDGTQIIKPSGTATILQTGITTYTEINNIYDFVGNIYEWTQEAFGSSSSYNRYNRSARGTDYGDSGGSVFYRGCTANVADGGFGRSTRPTLYIRTTQSTKSSLEKLRDAGNYVTKKTTVYDSNGNKVVIPQGFKVASDSGINVTEGIVIEDNDIIQGIGNNRGNQYVWVPVSNVDGNNSSDGTEQNLITLDNGNKVEITLGRYTFDTTNGNPTQVQKGSQASEVTSSNYSDSSNNKYKIGYNTEFSDAKLSDGPYIPTSAQNLLGFIESVKNNNGYYIARYEASYGTDEKPNSKVSNSFRTDNNTALTNGMLWNRINQPNASLKCQNIYNTVNTDLTNSYAWDTAIIYIQSMGNSNYANVKDGNGTLKNTGTIGDEKCKINDLAANEMEWNTEFVDNVQQYINWKTVRRGSLFSDANYYASSRSTTRADFTDNEHSFRPILWL